MVSPLPKPAYNDMVVGPDGPITVRYRRKVPLAQAKASKAGARAQAARAAEMARERAASGAAGAAADGAAAARPERRWSS